MHEDAEEFSDSDFDGGGVTVHRAAPRRLAQAPPAEARAALLSWAKDDVGTPARPGIGHNFRALGPRSGVEGQPCRLFARGACCKQAPVLCWQVARLLFFQQASAGFRRRSDGMVLLLRVQARLTLPCLQRMRLVLRSSSTAWLSRSWARLAHGSACKPRLSWCGGHSTCSCPMPWPARTESYMVMLTTPPECLCRGAPFLAVFGRPLRQLRSLRRWHALLGCTRQCHGRDRRIAVGAWAACWCCLVHRAGWASRARLNRRRIRAFNCLRTRRDRRVPRCLCRDFRAVDLIQHRAQVPPGAWSRTSLHSRAGRTGP